MHEALVFRGPWEIGIERRGSGGELGPTDVVIRVHATGICGTDIGIVTGQYQARKGVVIGHESAGIVVERGREVSTVAVGDRVAIDPTYFCGKCPMCRTDRPNHCEQKARREAGVSLDGTFAHFYRTDERFVFPIAEHVSFDEASLSEPLSCVLTGLNQLRLRADMHTVVVGGGPIGMLYCYALAARGFTGSVVEVSPGRRERCGAALPAGWNALAPDACRDHSLDLVVDTSGQVLDWALGAMRRGGQICAVGLTSATFEIRPAMLADRSISIVGSIDSIGTFGLAVRMIETGAIPVARLITHRLPLTDHRRGFSLVGLDLDARRRSLEDIDAIKVVLRS